MYGRFNPLNRLAMILVTNCQLDDLADFLIVSISQISMHFPFRD